MTATLATVRGTPTLELSASVLRAFASLVPTSSAYKTVPRLCILDPLPDGRVRAFSSDGVSAVIVRAEGHCQRPMALGMPILRRLLNSHRDAELVSIVARDDEPFLRVQSFSTGMTLAIEGAAEECFADAAAIDRIEAMGDGESGGSATMSVLALQPLRALLAAGGAINRVHVRVMAGEGPLVIDAAHPKEGWSARVITMRLRERE